MTSKERLLSVWNGKKPDHIPLTTWCFGFTPPTHLRWRRDGQEIKHWYSMRMEHIHTLKEPWGLEDDFKRVIAWRSLDIDDILDVSVPWSIAQEITWEDSIIPAGKIDVYPVLIREYKTPSGILRHAVKKTEESPNPGWVIQPDYVALFEDYNIPRYITPAVSKPEDIPKIKHLYMPPDEKDKTWFYTRMRGVKKFAYKNGVAVQAWSAFGMDAVVWLTGAEGAVMMAIDNPRVFGELLDIITETDLARAELAASSDGIDMIVERGWYSSTDFWSPKLFDQFLYPHIEELVKVTHKYGKKFGYVMTTGVEILGPRLADAGVDVLYFIDPVQDRISLERARELFEGRMTVVGGINSISLATGDLKRIKEEVRRVIDILGPTNRFILQPVDALFPDTPWEGVEVMLETWRKYR